MVQQPYYSKALKAIVMIFYSFMFLTCSLLSQAQKMPNVEAMNRVILKRGDTVYQFYAVKAPKKFKSNQAAKYSWYTPDTVLITEGSFSGRLLNGMYSVFYPNNNLFERGYFQFGLKNGQWKTWYPDGTLQRTSSWKNGYLDGQFIEFSASGKKVKEGRYKNGLLNGKISTYSSDGKREDILYKKGIKVEPKVAPSPTTDSTSSAQKNKQKS